MNLTGRVRYIRRQNWRWYDWGHRVMVLTGRSAGWQDEVGTYDVPRVHDMWFRHEDDGTIRTTWNYDEVRNANDGEWRVFDSQNDGFEIVIGYWPHPDGDGRIQRSGLDGRGEQRLFLKWFLWHGVIVAEWFGLRRWIYYKALHSVVDRKIPFTCQASPNANSHWHCGLSRRHKGNHRVRNYVWDRSGAHVKYSPVKPELWRVG